MRAEQGYQYGVVAWLASATYANESDGDVLGEWAASTIAIAEAAMWSELHGIFDGEFPEGKTIIIEVRKYPTTDAASNPI